MNDDKKLKAVEGSLNYDNLTVNCYFAGVLSPGRRFVGRPYDERPLPHALEFGQAGTGTDKIDWPKIQSFEFRGAYTTGPQSTDRGL